MTPGKPLFRFVRFGGGVLIAHRSVKNGSLKSISRQKNLGNYTQNETGWVCLGGECVSVRVGVCECVGEFVCPRLGLCGSVCVSLFFCVSQYESL